MKIEIGDLFDYKYRKGKIITIMTTSSTIKNNGELVMGNGAAQEAKRNFPGIALDAGNAIKSMLKISAFRGYGFIFIKPQIGIFQVKQYFKSDAELELIQFSTHILLAYANQLTTYKFNMNFPGIGRGNLREKDVMPIVRKLPNNVTLFKKEK